MPKYLEAGLILYNVVKQRAKCLNILKLNAASYQSRAMEKTHTLPIVHFSHFIVRM